MTDKLCPFCGEVHRKVHWNKVIGYDAKEGSPILGQLNIGVDLTVHNPGGATVYVPIDLYNTRPIEDAQAAEIAKLELDLLQAGRLEHELNAIITDKDAEIEKIAVVLENETGLLNDDTLTSERLEEILRAMKHQAEHASELIKEKDAEIERLQNALDRIIDIPNTEPYLSRRYDTIIDIASTARDREVEG